MDEPVRRLRWPGQHDVDEFLTQEWLVTNGLGGYASGTVAGVATRRFHGWLIAALPAPLGRTMMLNELHDTLYLANGSSLPLCGEERRPGHAEVPLGQYLAEFRLEAGLPVWRYEIGQVVLEKQLLLLHRQNTVHLTYRLVASAAPVRLQLRPAINFRPHARLVGEPFNKP